MNVHVLKMRSSGSVVVVKQLVVMYWPMLHHSVQTCVDLQVASAITDQGFARNEEGDCIPEDECQQQSTAACAENEVLVQGSSCETTCSDVLANTTPTCCQCPEGFARNEQGNCIPTGECQP